MAAVEIVMAGVEIVVAAVEIVMAGVEIVIAGVEIVIASPDGTLFFGILYPIANHFEEVFLRTGTAEADLAASGKSSTVNTKPLSIPLPFPIFAALIT